MRTLRSDDQLSSRGSPMTSNSHYQGAFAFPVGEEDGSQSRRGGALHTAPQASTSQQMPLSAFSKRIAQVSSRVNGTQSRAAELRNEARFSFSAQSGEGSAAGSRIHLAASPDTRWQRCCAFVFPPCRACCLVHGGEKPVRETIFLLIAT